MKGIAQDVLYLSNRSNDDLVFLKRQIEIHNKN